MGDFDIGKRRGDDIERISQLRPSDKMTPKPDSEVKGRRLYGSKWVVDRVEGDRAVLQRRSNGRRRDEFLEIGNADLDQFRIHTVDQSRSFWSGYSKEGGHHIM